MIKPPFSYFGGKTTLAPTIVGLLPPHEHYVEPYGGSLAVLLAKPPARMETVNDIDAGLMTFWRVLRQRPDDLIRQCALTPHSRREYDSCRKAPVVDGDDLETARRVWVILTQGRAGTLAATGWRYYVDPRGSSIGVPAYLDAYVGRMAEVVERLRTVSLESMPAVDLIAKYGGHQDTLLYVDPPYLGTTRAGVGGRYRHEMRDAREHERLAEILHATRAAVVLSGYDSPLYRRLYDGWDRVELVAASGNAAQGTRVRVEVLWSNRRIRRQAFLFDFLAGEPGHHVPPIEKAGR